MHHVIATTFAAALALAGTTAFAAQLPPAGSLPLSTILEAIEADHPGAISEAELEHGIWEIKVCADGRCEKLDVAPADGRVLRSRRSGRDDVPPAGAASASELVRRIEAAGIGTVTEIEFEHGHWEVKMQVDPGVTR